MKVEHINDGSKDGVLAYYCECGNCKVWDTNQDMMEQIEKLHFKRNKVLEEYNALLQQFREEENRILGIEPLNLERFKIKR